MKLTADGKEISSRIWYYLLDWNELDEWRSMKLIYKKDKLRDLTKAQIVELFEIATQFDHNILNS
jgi:hypothetical protein